MGGDHGHGHGHGPPYKIPDYKIYKVENCPELVELQEKLAEKGLKDPWLRNEAWRYDRKIFGTPATNLRSALTRGVGTGIALTLVTILITSIVSGKKSDHHSEHH